MPPLEFGTIRGFGDFRAALLRAGFAVGGENDEGIFSLRPYMDPSLQYHTGDPETDPWLWRVRVLEDRALAGGKVFFGKAGWISREWYPLFLAVRRRGKSLEELYADGLVSRLDREVYRTVARGGSPAGTQAQGTDLLRQTVPDRGGAVPPPGWSVSHRLRGRRASSPRMAAPMAGQSPWSVRPRRFFQRTCGESPSGYHRGRHMPDPGAGAPPESAGGRKAYSPLHRRMNPTMAAYSSCRG